MIEAFDDKAMGKDNMVKSEQSSKLSQVRLHLSIPARKGES